jgi:hypothetical protein
LVVQTRWRHDARSYSSRGRLDGVVCRDNVDVDGGQSQPCDSELVAPAGGFSACEGCRGHQAHEDHMQEMRDQCVEREVVEEVCF